MCGVKEDTCRLPALALYADCSLARIESFEKTKDFIKGSAILNGTVAAGLFYLAQSATKYAAERNPSQNKASLTTLALELLAFGTLNSYVGGITAFSLEKCRPVIQTQLAP